MIERGKRKKKVFIIKKIFINMFEKKYEIKLLKNILF